MTQPWFSKVKRNQIVLLALFPLILAATMAGAAGEFVLDFPRLWRKLG